MVTLFLTVLQVETTERTNKVRSDTTWPRKRTKQGNSIEGFSTVILPTNSKKIDVYPTVNLDLKLANNLVRII